jgi:perosamine synthetase
MGDLSWRFDSREMNYISEVLDSGFASGTSGSMNTRLEEEFAKVMGQKYAITFNSGTTTLHAALEAFGVGYGDEVIVTPLTVISCMNAILYCNAIPVFADVDPDTFLMDPESIKKKITSRTKAIMVVHLYGQVADMTSIMKIAKDNNLKVLEDCAQCYLGTHNNKLGGAFGDVGSWSFENSKHLTTGDGGIVTTDDEKLGDLMRKLSCQGFKNATAVSGKIRTSKSVFQQPDFKRHNMLGYMYRLPEVAAAMGLAQVEKIDFFVNKRIQMGNLYTQVINDLGCDWLVPQKTPEGDVNCYYTYAMKLVNPDVDWTEFRKFHEESGGDGIYAAWSLCYLEDSMDDIKSRLRSIGYRKWKSKLGLLPYIESEKGICPEAEKLQPQLMQLTTNQKDEDEMKKQADLLYKTIKHFS